MCISSLPIQDPGGRSVLALSPAPAPEAVTARRRPSRPGAGARHKIGAERRCQQRCPMADTFSFDVVSDFDRQELVNAVDQVRREVGQRYDLKDSGTEIELEEAALTITTASDMTLDAVADVLRQKATKRNLSLKIFDFQPPEPVGGNKVKQVVTLRRGLNQELAKKLSKKVRDNLKKVTVAIQGESLRITGKSKDDLQQAIQLLKSEDLELPLQFENYR
jgi:uncharacterized protein YajQ (UPF0234 family)